MIPFMLSIPPSLQAFLLQYYDGDWIYVNVKWQSEGYAMAYENGTYGYVDASYIDW